MVYLPPLVIAFEPAASGVAPSEHSSHFVAGTAAAVAALSSSTNHGACAMTRRPSLDDRLPTIGVLPGDKRGPHDV